MNLIMLGAPGSGKGTMAKRISNDFAIPHISTGDIFRQNIKDGTELGNKVKAIMEEGRLVPDELTIALVKDRLNETDCKNGFILDGFPRTLVQAKELEKFAKIDSVVLIDVPFEEIEERLEGRRSCPNCGEVYHINTYAEPHCQKCNTKLIQREDDKLETVRARLKVYESQTSPLIKFYEDKIFKAEGKGTPEETYAPVKEFLKEMIKWS